MAYFLNLFSSDTWRAFLEMGGEMTGFRKSMSTRAHEEVNPGDIFISYLTKTARWCGALRAESDAYLEEEDLHGVFADFPVRFTVSTIVALRPELMIPTLNDRIQENWSVARRYADKPGGVPGYLSSSLRLMDDKDGEFFLQYLKEQGTNPTIFPLNAKDRSVLSTLLESDSPVAPTGDFSGTDSGSPVRLPYGELHTLAEELHLTEDFLRNIVVLLEEKKQVIFQGPPGTGKTYVALALARHLAGTKDRVKLVQFHPSYAYEDFVQGFRPRKSGDGFDLKDGPLRRIAEQAKKASNVNHYLVIDEINRGNLAKVFGELYFLLEYRDQEIQLQYSDKAFSLPDNLRIIGTMNTADRSIALVDLALRRRFYFVEFDPTEDPVKSVLHKWLSKNASDMMHVADIVERANQLLKDDPHATVGPSYFMRKGLDHAAIERIWKHSVLPYLQERLFYDRERLVEFALERLDPTASSSGDQTGVHEQENPSLEGVAAE